MRAEELLAIAEGIPDVEVTDYRDATAITFRGHGFAHLRGDGRVLYVKATRDEREAVVESDPETYSRWWASGRFGWIKVRLEHADAAEVVELFTEAWRLCAPKRMVASYDLEHGLR